MLDICKDTKIEKVMLQHLASVNVDGEDSNYLYKLFFIDEGYEIFLPHYIGRIINI